MATEPTLTIEMASKSRPPEKHSLSLRGHRTSVSLEAEFWREFRRISAEDDKPINALAAEIDAMRDPEVGLASAIRVYVLNRVLARVPDPS